MNSTVAAEAQARAALAEFADQSGLPGGKEWSIKLTGGRVLRDRFLLSYCALDLQPAHWQALADVLLAMGLPESVFTPPLTLLRSGQCDFFHLGWEGDVPARAKWYLDYSGRLPEPWSDGAEVFTAFKWYPGVAGVKLNHYRYQSFLRPDALITACALALGGDEHGLAGALANLLTAHFPLQDLPGLVVTEAGTDRHSLDLNLYDVTCCIADLWPWLQRALPACGLDVAALADLQQSNPRVGHLALGRAADGALFITLYLALEEQP